MKYLKITMIVMTLGVMSLALTNCSSKSKTGESVDKSGPEYTSAYVCPMHCKGSGSDEMGNCPVCGMEYVKNKNHEMHEGSHKGHNHNMDAEHHMYACPMHPEITGDEGDKCSKCGMEMTRMEGDDHMEHDHEDHSGHDHD